MIDLVEDRLAALRALGPEGVAGLLDRVPALAEAVAGRGPLAYPRMVAEPWRRPSPRDTPRRLAEVLASGPGTLACLHATTALELQLVGLARWHGGSLTHDEALEAVAATDEEAAADPHLGPRLDAAAQAVAGLALTAPGGGWLALRPGVADRIGLPGVSILGSLGHITSQQIAVVLRNLGVGGVPSRKYERSDLLLAALGDRGIIGAAIAGLDDEARRVLELLLWHGPTPVRDLGVPTYTSWHRLDTPLHRLVERGLVGVDEPDQVAWAWMEVEVTLRGGLYGAWPVAAPAAEPVALSPGGSGVAEVLARLSGLLDLWAADPAPALASGGLGVRPIRAAAKALGVDAGVVGLLAHLAVRLGALGRIQTGASGRGRNRTITYAWSPTRMRADLEALPPARRWALLVQAWLDDALLDEAGGLPERIDSDAEASERPLRRRALLRALADLPEATGLAEDDLIVLAHWRSPTLLGDAETTGLVAALRALGLVPVDGPIGLAPFGRAVLDGPDAAEAAQVPGRAEFVVQADHTVIAPPDLDPGVATRLARYAELESDAGARIYRIAEQRLARALDDGESEADVLSFLTEHATVDVPGNVAHLIGDVARRHGRLRVGAARSYLRCDDPALLARAVAVRPAKLRTLAPTVAVSPLASDKLLAALRAKGLMPTQEDDDGAVLAGGPAGKVALRGDADPAFGIKRLPDLDPRPLRPDPTALVETAAALLARADEAAAPDLALVDLRWEQAQ